MPRFFFNLRHGEDFEPDLTGLDLPNAEAARSGAVFVLHDLSVELAKGGLADWTLEVVDAAGTIILRVLVADAFPLAPPFWVDERRDTISHP